MDSLELIDTWIVKALPVVLLAVGGTFLLGVAGALWSASQAIRWANQILLEQSGIYCWNCTTGKPEPACYGCHGYENSCVCGPCEAREWDRVDKQLRRQPND